MYIIMNRFKIVPGKEKKFEEVWRDRDTHLDKIPGFKEFNLARGDIKEDYTLCASHSKWDTKETFIGCSKSESFRLAHKILFNKETCI